MGTSREEIQGWIKEGQAKGASHLIVACDTFSWDDYPVYVMPNEDVQKKYKDYNGPNMQKVMEVYNLQKDIDFQINQHRSFNF